VLWLLTEGGAFLLKTEKAKLSCLAEDSLRPLSAAVSGLSRVAGGCLAEDGACLGLDFSGCEEGVEYGLLNFVRVFRVLIVTSVGTAVSVDVECLEELSLSLLLI